MGWVPATVFSQMLGNTGGQVFGDKPAFVTDFVRNHKIKNINGTYTTKAELDYIRPSSDVITYKFNRAGELSQEYKVQSGDTIMTVFVYDEHGNVITMRRSDRWSFISYHYEYDSRNRITRSELRRDDNKGQDRLTFEPDKSKIVSSETFGYVELEKGNYKKMYYNENGSTYREEFFYFDEAGRLIRQEGVLKTGTGRSDITYTYDKEGRLIEKYSETEMMGIFTEKQVYEYDQWGNILAQRYYKDGKYTTEFQLLYNEDTQELKAIITRDHATNFMTILSLKDYTYFD